MASLRQRSTETEIMDDLHCSGEVVHQTLRELEFINHWLGGNHVTINGLRILVNEVKPAGKINIVDLGCGGGDMLRLIGRFGRKNRIPMRLTGIDANPNIIAYARTNVQEEQVEFESINIFSEEFRKRRFGIVVGTLFFHHFSNEELIDFFRSVKGQVSIGIIINDIHRHPLAYYSIKFLTSLFSKSSMVRYDAPLSVRRAFKRDEIEHILRSAGYDNFTIRWKWAFRWQVIIPVNH
jgi:2-polyprenyl-3-methyl-5-hydroxy-6-metoxy-1,4-benzoquinol methylase